MPTAWVRLLPFHSNDANEFLYFLISPSPYANCPFAKIVHFCNKTRDVTPFFSSKMLQNDDFMPIVSFMGNVTKGGFLTTLICNLLCLSKFRLLRFVTFSHVASLGDLCGVTFSLLWE